MKYIRAALLCGMLIWGVNGRADDTAAPQQQAETKKIDWRFAVGVSYMSGFQDVSDRYLDAYGIDATVIPVGVSFNATLQIAHGNTIASIPSVGVGPVGFIYAKETVYGNDYYDSFSTSYVDIPITATYGVKFMPNGPVGPYIRGGIAYHIARGDAVESSSPGGFVGAGVEFLQNRRVSLAIEAAYDSSTVSFSNYSGYFGSIGKNKIKTGNTLFSVRVVF